MAIQRDARHVQETKVDRRVPGDVAATLEGLPHLEIIDVGVVHTGTTQRFADGVLREVEGGHVEQRAFPRGADCGPSSRDDDSVTHR